MRLEELINELLALQTSGRAQHDSDVRLIVNGVAHPVDQVWWEPRQEQVGAVCIGDDPR